MFFFNNRFWKIWHPELDLLWISLFNVPFVQNGGSLPQRKSTWKFGNTTVSVASFVKKPGNGILVYRVMIQRILQKMEVGAGQLTNPAFCNPLLVGKGKWKSDPLEALNMRTCKHPNCFSLFLYVYETTVLVFTLQACSWYEFCLSTIFHRYYEAPTKKQLRSLVDVHKYNSALFWNYCLSFTFIP